MWSATQPKRDDRREATIVFEQNNRGRLVAKGVDQPVEACQAGKELSMRYTALQIGVVLTREPGKAKVVIGH